MTGLVVVLIICIFWLLYNIGKNENERLKNLKDLEENFLIGMAWTEEHKHHMLQILQIVYDKAAENDPQFSKDYEKILKTIEEKINNSADKWIIHMNEVLGYKTVYRNWGEATKYINEVVEQYKKQKYDNRGAS